MNLAAASEEIEGVGEGFRGGRRTEVERVLPLSRRRRKLLNSSTLGSGTRRPADSAASAANHVDTTGVAEDRQPVAGGERLIGHHPGNVQELTEMIGADDTRLVEESVSTATPSDAAAAVCEAPARLPATDRPLNTAMTGLRLASARATRASLRGFPNDSRYSATAEVAGSSNQ
jgi:hypothetical protein